MKAIVLVMPLVQSLIFGYAVTTDVKRVPTAVYDQAETPESRAIVDKFIHSGYFSLRAAVRDEREMDALIMRGEVAAAIRIPSDF